MPSVVAVAVCAILVFAVAPNLTWLIIGSQEIDHRCNKYAEPPDLAVWLVVQGSVGLFVTILGIGMALVRAGVAGFVVMTVFNLFFLAWLIIGAVRLSDDLVCEMYANRLYNTAVAAVIVGFVSVFLNVIQSILGMGKSDA